MDTATLEALGQILKEERDITDQQISSVMAKLGDSGLIPRIAINRLEEQKAAVEHYVDSLMLKKSKVVSKSAGRVHYHLKALDQ